MFFDSPGAQDENMLEVRDNHCNAAAVITTNKFCAAPVVVSKQLLKNGDPQIAEG